MPVQIIKSTCLPEYAISVRQPWAELLLRRQKTVEYRLWPLPEMYWNKWLCLHISVGMTRKEKKDVVIFCGTSDLPRGGYAGKIRFGRPYLGKTPPEVQAYVQHHRCWYWPVTGIEWMAFTPAKGQLRIFKVK